jgi:hypothetical protein
MAVWGAVWSQQVTAHCPYPSAEAYQALANSTAQKYLAVGGCVVGTYRIFSMGLVTMKINSCAKAASYTRCVQTITQVTNPATVADHPHLWSGNVLTVLLRLSAYSYQCSETFANKNMCGVYLEIHSHCDPRVQSSGAQETASGQSHGTRSVAAVTGGPHRHSRRFL